jgi:hypothetical protein
MKSTNRRTRKTFGLKRNQSYCAIFPCFLDLIDSKENLEKTLFDNVGYVQKTILLKGLLYFLRCIGKFYFLHIEGIV